MFTKITRTNHNGKELETIINTDMVISVKEKETTTTNLYDELGNVVETRENPKMYGVYLKGGIHYNLNETQYSELVKVLVK